MNYNYNQGIMNLVAEYEAMTERGTVPFLEEGAYQKLIAYYEQDEQIDRALEVVEHAMHYHRFSVDFYVKKAELLLSDHRPAQALLVLDEAAAYAPDEPEISLLRAEGYIRLGQYEEAACLLDYLKEGAGSELLSDVYCVEAMAFESQELYERMYYALKAALMENPGNREALARIWMGVELCRKYEEAVELHEKILEADPYATLAWYNMGHAQAYNGDYFQAIECYEYAYLTDERFEPAYRECAELCFEMKQYHKALRCYEELMERFDADSDILLRIGQCHQYLGNFKIAVTFYGQTLRHDPFDDEALYHTGLCFMEEGNWTKAIRYFQKAIQIEDSREEYYGALARAYFHVGKHEKAEANFEKAVDIAPEQNQYWIDYACFLMQTDRGEEALDILEAADECAAGVELMYCRIVCLFFLGRRKEGLYWLGEALTEDFESHALLFNWMPALERDSDVLSMISAYTA